MVLCRIDAHVYFYLPVRVTVDLIQYNYMYIYYYVGKEKEKPKFYKNCSFFLELPAIQVFIFMINEHF